MTGSQRPDGEWDRWLAACGPEADFLQTSHWALIDSAANARSSRVIAVGGIAAALVSHPAEGGGELRCLHGPVLRDPDAIATVDEIIDSVHKIASMMRCTSVRFIGRPPLSAADIDALACRFRRHGYSSVPWSTSVVDLRRTEADLLAGCDRAVPKALRRAEHAGVRVRLCEDSESFEGEFLAAFCSVRPDYDPEIGRAMFSLDAGRAYRFYVAVDEAGVALATLGTYRFGGVATEVMSVRTAVARRSGVPAQDFLHWRVMRDHRDLGDSWFDLAGHAVVPASPAEAGIRRFKRKWGGCEVPSPTLARDLRPPPVRLGSWVRNAGARKLRR